MNDTDYKKKIEEANKIYEDYLNELSRIHTEFLKGLAEIRKKEDQKNLERLKNGSK